MKSARQLALVSNESAEARLKRVLRESFEARDHAAQQLRHIDAIIAAEIREYARIKGVAFMRVESVRREVMG